MPTWLIPWLIYSIGAVLALGALFMIFQTACNYAPPLRRVRVNVWLWWDRVIEAIRNDPPPLYTVIRNLIVELIDEYGPQLQSSTNRNALLLALTSFLGVAMPPQWAAAGAAYVVVGATVFYFLRTMAGRKAAAGPIVTPRDLAKMRAVLDGDVRGAGAAAEALNDDFWGAGATSEDTAPADPADLVIDAGCQVRVNTPPADSVEQNVDAPAPRARTKRVRGGRGPRPTPRPRKAAKKAKKTAKRKRA